MSINQYSPSSSGAYWWASQSFPITSSNDSHHQPTATATAIPTAMFCGNNSPNLDLNLNQDDEELDDQIDDKESGSRHSAEELPKEALFEKPLTPSDVGKLNRLVIPKQHAEKYFPLTGGESGEKGFLLGFEDEVGKSWRFRYSYWNSSQSYVLTKGWSRFVKEKKLDAGDIVLFQRHRLDCTRLFIGWRRKNSAPPPALVAGGGGWTHLYSGHPYPPHQPGISLPYQPEYRLHAGSAMQNQTRSSGNSKKLRLFGVNLECQPDESEAELSTSGGSSGSNRGRTQYLYHQHYPQSHSYSQMDINFTGDDDRGYRQG